jgi:FkbM family methyltransferase
MSVTRFPSPQSLAGHLKVLFGRLGIDFVLDVGAHRGDYVRLLRDIIGFRGRIASFEPGADSYAELQSACGADERWAGHRYALGRSEGTAALNGFARTEFNSFLEPTEYGRANFRGKADVVMKSEVVAVKRLDDVFDDVIAHVGDPHVHLKVDTQGYDLEVLEGAAAVIDRVLSLQVELSVKSVYRDQPTFPEAWARILDLGFEVTGLFPVSSDLDRLRLVELDGVFLRSRGVARS